MGKRPTSKAKRPGDRRRAKARPIGSFPIVKVGSLPLFGRKGENPPIIVTSNTRVGPKERRISKERRKDKKPEHTRTETITMKTANSKRVPVEFETPTIRLTPKELKQMVAQGEKPPVVNLRTAKKDGYFEIVDRRKLEDNAAYKKHSRRGRKTDTK